MAPGVTVAAGDVDATFLPDDAMRGVSLRHRGEELLAPDIPFLHPWANRLSAWSYDVDGTHANVAIDAPTDENGLPIHGTVAGMPFVLTHAAPDRCRAELDATAQPRIMASFPFPHAVTIEVHASAGTITVSTTLRATGGVAVPVAFGFHPYFRLPGSPRGRWRLRLPPRRHVALDARHLPAGTRDGTPEPEDDAAIAHRRFDDHYVLGDDRRFVLADDRRRLTVTFGPAYPRAQLYVPEAAEVVCIEPMTAPVNALVEATAALLGPGEALVATWNVGISEV